MLSTEEKIKKFFPAPQDSAKYSISKWKSSAQTFWQYNWGDGSSISERFFTFRKVN